MLKLGRLGARGHFMTLNETRMHLIRAFLDRSILICRAGTFGHAGWFEAYSCVTHCIVSLVKELYSTLSLSTHVYK